MAPTARIIVPFLVAVALYNVHGLADRLNDRPYVIENRMDGHIQYAVVDTSQISARQVKNFCVQLAFLQAFLFLGWAIGTFRAKAWAIGIALWFALQALQVAMGGNILRYDWMDWLVLVTIASGVELIVVYHNKLKSFNGHVVR